MSWWTVVKRAVAPGAPAAGRRRHWVDSADGRLKALDGDDGQTYTLSRDTYPVPSLINAGFRFAQRQVPGTLTTYSSVGGRAYTADRWFVSNETASVQYQRIDARTTPETGLRFPFYGRFKKITNAGKIVVGQFLTGDLTAAHRGQKVRVTVKLRRTVAAAMTVRVALVQLSATGAVDVIPINAGTFVTAFGANGTDPTLGANLAYIAPDAGSADGGTIVGNALQCVLSGAWARYSAVFSVPSTALNIGLLVWTDSQLAALDELNIAEPDLPPGPEIRDAANVPLSLDLLRCQRFYAKSFPIDVAPAQNAGLAGAAVAHAVAGAVAAIFGIRYPYPMRATPTTVTFFNPAAANAFVRNILKATDATVTTAANGSDSGTMVNVTGLAAWVAGDGIGIHYTAEAEI